MRLPLSGIFCRCLGACLVLAAFATTARAEGPWRRHVIDDSSKGADGARLRDVNGDGLPDIVTGWEQGGVTRLALHPGSKLAKDKWPAVEVGRTPDAEDAVLVDLDGDGALDVVSSCEGKTRSIFVSWAPPQKDQLLNPTAWQQAALPASAKTMSWMFVVPMQIDGQHGVDLFAGGKGNDAQIGWFEAPPSARDLDQWKWHPLRPVGWTMSLIPADMDGDEDLDVVFSDRKQKRSGVYWLENPGSGKAQDLPWPEHTIGGVGREVMFLDLADFDRDGLIDVLAAVKPAEALYLRRRDRSGKQFETHTIPFPKESGIAKAVSVGDINRDGQLDLVVSCENAVAPKHGVSWLRYRDSPTAGPWDSHQISGADGVKHDLVPLFDLDGDGDLDVITTEEVHGLGVIWYENPS